MPGEVERPVRAARKRLGDDAELRALLLGVGANDGFRARRRPLVERGQARQQVVR